MVSVMKETARTGVVTSVKSPRTPEEVIHDVDPGTTVSTQISVHGKWVASMYKRPSRGDAQEIAAAFLAEYGGSLEEASLGGGIGAMTVVSGKTRYTVFFDMAEETASMSEAK